MSLEAEYSVTATLRTFPDGARLLRAHGHDGRAVGIKVLASDRVARAEAERLRNEYEVGRRLECAAVLQPLALGTWSGAPALVLEGFGGEPLDTMLGEPMPLARFLPLAERITRALADVHAGGVVHRDVKPQNILVGVGPSEGQVKLAGLGIASLLPAERGSVKGATLIEGALAYMSPEQTGRMDRHVDGRSDLYSLGVTFYEMLSGRRPFEAKDPLEWIHCHIARLPPPLLSVAPGLPPVLSAVVMKLLSKLADERYQTALGLAHDLERCRRAYEATGELPAFPLGAHDVPEHFQIPQRLYGREQEIAALLAAFRRVVERGAPELVLVAGGAGAGKSRLVHEMEEPIVRARGFFVSSKFDQLKADIPYSTFVAAFREVVLEILAGTDETVSLWRKRLREALGVNAQLVVDVLPSLALIVGDHPPPPELPPAESQNRLRIVFRQCVGVFARAEHPLTLFLDDLQWADMASLALLQDLLTGPERRCLFVIGAYRDNEVGASHPLTAMLEEVSRHGANVGRIGLGPLARKHVEALVSDALRCPPEQAAPLAELVHHKTAGNPFFAVQFLTTLHDEHLLELDRRAGAWRWDLAKIRGKSFTDNVVELMVAKLERLRPSTRAALKDLACVGSAADLTTLAMVHGRSEAEMLVELRDALAAGLLVLSGDTYRFVHDRVQEAAYSLVPESSRAAAHLRIGRILVTHLTGEVLDERVFDIVNQLNRGASLITEAREKETLCRLNAMAGRKAKAAIAYAAGRNHFLRATELLPPDAWSRHHEETFTLFLDRSECEALAGEFARADELFGMLLAKARSNPERAKASILRMRLYQIVGRFADGVEVMLDSLRRMGVSFPGDDEAAEAALLLEQHEVAVNLRGRPIADIVNAPLATDPDVRATISVLVAATPCANVGRPKLFPLVVVRALNLALRHGNTEDASFAYGAYGTLLVGIFDDVHSAFEFTQMAIRLNERLGVTRLKPTLRYLHAQFVHGWRRPLATALPVLEEVFPAFLEVGELVFASYHAVLTVWMTLESGANLAEVLRVSETYAAFVQACGNETALEAIRVQQDLVASLTGHTRGAASSEDAGVDQARVQPPAVFHVARQVACHHAGRHEEALAHAERAAESLGAVMATSFVIGHHFHLALTLAALHAGANVERRAELEARLDVEVQRLARWAASCPENFADRHALVAAEAARIHGRDLEAMRLYEDAIRAARAHGSVQNEALAFELASAFYRARGFDHFAESYLREARSRYARWGARAKVARLAAAAPGPLDSRPEGASATFTASAQQLDLFSIVGALQTISGAIVFDELLRTLLKIVLEHGGAQRATLFVAESGRPIDVAEAETTGAGVVVSHRSRGASAGKVPQAIVDYVWRTKERVLLDDALERNRFSGDEYVTRTKPRSVLCLPIVRQGEMAGLLYLENNLLTRAFTPDRLSVLELLASQAAISLENARLYAELEREVTERRAAERAMRESEGVLEAIADNAPLVVFVKDLEGRYVLSNRPHEEVFGAARGGLFGKTDFDLFPAETAEMFVGNDRAVLEGGVPISFEEHVVERDGVHTYSVTKFPLRREDSAPFAVGGIASDVTERMRATEALRQSEERFRLLVDGMKDCAIFMADPNGRVMSWNAGAQRLFGYEEDEVLGRAVACFFTAEDTARGAPDRAFARARAEGASEQDGWRLRKDGSRFFADVVLTALTDEKGAIRGYSALVRDLTQRLKLEEQVREAQKMEAIGRLAGGVAHDFNNLLGAIYGFVYHGLRGLEPDSPVRADLEEIQDAARRAGELTAQLLAFARKQRIAPRVFVLNDLVLSMDRLLRRVLGDDVELVTLPSPDPGSVEADPGQIEQVVLNLAVNARDAMPGGGKLTIETARAELGDEEAARSAGVSPGRYMLLALTDTGTGMPPEVLEHVFEPFFTTKGAGMGTGLGLATSYGIVKQAGGHIGVYSELGRGTTFEIYLPLSTKDGVSPLLAPLASPVAKGETVLLVEDHAMLRNVAMRGLKALGYEVLAAESGDEALRLAEAHAGTIHLLLTDVMMPRMNGHELAQRLAALRPGLKVLYVSGYTESSMIRSGESRHARLFLAKPFTPDELARRVREVLDGMPS